MSNIGRFGKGNNIFDGFCDILCRRREISLVFDRFHRKPQYRDGLAGEDCYYYFDLVPLLPDARQPHNLHQCENEVLLTN